MHKYTVAVGSRQLAPVMVKLNSRMGQDLLCMAFMDFYVFFFFNVMISLLSYLLDINQDHLSFYSSIFV